MSDDQLSFGELPERAHARRTDPHTSHEAAASIAEDELRASQARVLELLSFGPATDLELAARYAELGPALRWPPPTPSGLRSRRRELVDKGLAHDSGQRVFLPSGRRSIVWAQGPPPANVIPLRPPG